MLFLGGGGWLARTLAPFLLTRGGRLRAGRMSAFVAALTWLPLLILAIVDGIAWGDRVDVPLVKDFLPYGQFLVAVPVLILGDASVGLRLGRAAAELRRSNVLASDDTPAWEEFLTRAVGRWRDRGVNLVILLLTLAITVLSFFGAKEWLTGGWQFVGERLTMPGWWYLAISASVLRFLTLRWLWRAMLWAWVLWRASRLRLEPQPTHPDRAGGLAFLGTTQASFGILAFALGVQLSCLVADAVRYQGADLMAYRGHVTAFVFIAVILLLLPLVPFAPKLVRARGDSLVFLSECGYRGAESLERQLRADPSQALPADDVSGLADFGALYENARGMKPVPLDLRHILAIVLAALLPFLPLVFLVMPAQDLFQALAGLVL